MQKENSNGKQEMSFSGKIKEELARQWSEARHCQIAELAAIISMCGKVSIDSRENYSIKVRTENVSVARKYFTLLKKTFNIDTENSVARNKSNGSIYYTVIIKKHENAIKVLQERYQRNFRFPEICCYSRAAARERLSEGLF